jgi:surfeit locus 1 family protein
MNHNKLFKVVATGLVMLLLTGVFFELGLWQLHRAQSTSREGKVLPSNTPISLTSVDSAGKNIYTKAVNRIVTMQGHYVQSYIAPTQLVTGIGYKDLMVGLFLISNNRAILVVRGLNDGSIKPTTHTLSLVGRLYPRQQEDHGLNSVTSLGRLDPALVAGQGYSLFDGYVIATNEVNQSGLPVAGNRVPAPVLRRSISGFYWQHISYVVIWWFMGLLVLVAPFITKRSAKVLAAADKVTV